MPIGQASRSTEAGPSKLTRESRALGAIDGVD
jgi:hypothetical protein